MNVSQKPQLHKHIVSNWLSYPENYIFRIPVLPQEQQLCKGMLDFF